MSVKNFFVVSGYVAAIGATMAALPAPAAAQSLHGSHASINRMAKYAAKHDIYLYQTRAGVLKAVDKGRLVPLDGATYNLGDVHYPYVKPMAALFVDRLSVQYLAACGDTLVVTSAVRPATAQPWNSTPRSVHPAGIAVDLRKPPPGHCRTWLRNTLLSLEKEGVIEATEEFSPPHFHVAVFGVPYKEHVRQLVKASGAEDESKELDEPADKPTLVAYSVRPGDTLWGLARRHHTSVKRLMSVNRLSTSTLQPRQKLVLPE